VVVGVTRGPFIGQDREGRSHEGTKTASHEGAVNWPWSGFILLLLCFDGD
jgi:hypothetical protein